MLIVVTGASGFIGAHIAAELAGRGHTLTLLGGQRLPQLPSIGKGHTARAIGAIEASAGIAQVFQGADAVVHVAGLAHLGSHDPALVQRYSAANTDSVAAVCTAMAQKGVRRLVLVSSIAARSPINAYGHSKKAGEVLAASFAKSTGICVLSLRPPLVYGAGAPGNLAKLLRLIRLKVPLPFANVRNRRSLCAVENLSSAVAVAVEGVGVSGAYEVCDNEIVTLPEIVRALSDGCGIKARLWPFPVKALDIGLRLYSAAQADGLFGDMVLSNSALRTATGWQPRHATLAGLQCMAKTLTDL